jgi:hypothetical protein
VPEPIFDDIERTDARPGRWGESHFEFLNRTASKWFGACRALIEDWYGHVPAEHQADIRGRLRDDNARFDSALWELYLHESYRRSGYDVEIHPPVPDKTTRPDFLARRGSDRFYVEAVSVGRDQTEIAEKRRLDEVHRVLAEMKVTGFYLSVSKYGIGPRPLPTRKLRSELRRWLAGLDRDQVARDARSSPAVGLARLPDLLWQEDGWSLEIHAMPVFDDDRPRSALGVTGMGEAIPVDNESGLERVLDSKRSRYGALDAPLVIAIHSATDIRTYDYQVENALYGLARNRPHDRARGPGQLFTEGFWYGSSGWRSSHVPQVISLYDLAPWNVTNIRPRLWRTFEPGIAVPQQPGWLAQMRTGERAEPLPSDDLADHFGLAADWPGPDGPDFDLDNE